MRLLIVSNRLPVSVSKENGEYTVSKSAGGLVSGMSDYLKSLGTQQDKVTDYIWMGWPGTTVDKADEGLVREKVKTEFSASPVFLSETLMNKVYLGFCNKTIWPLFHYFPQHARFDLEFWEQYKEMNGIFCDEILKIVQPGDIIWIHDYHLMLLPRMLREKVDNPVGFFLHIPFPSYEMYRMLPGESRSQVLEGLMGADLIGFHTHDYAQYFLRCVMRILGRENHMGQIEMPTHVLEVGTFPMGIDFEKFHTMDVAPHRSHKAGPDEPRMVLSVDRLDYSKGIVNRLKGFEFFLQKYPQWHGKVYMNMIVVPSRTGVSTYMQIKKKLDELVGRINGAYGSISWTPVVYQFTSLPHNELIAQYRRSDIALLTPLRDGMNLVAKEYIASLTDQRGVLILSEFTGAAKELSESLVINPNSYHAIADAIAEGLEIPEKEKVRGNSIMQKRLRRYTVTRWATEFVGGVLESSKLSQDSVRNKMLNPEMTRQIVKGFREAGRRMMIFNYDGTLVPYTKYPAAAEPSAELLDLLRDLNALPNNDVVVISGRSKEELNEWLGHLPLNLTAEHGAWIRQGGQKKWKLFKPLSNNWKPDVTDIMEMYADRLPGAYIKEHEYSVAWHYHRADRGHAAPLASELGDHLLSITTNSDAQVVTGPGIIEVANNGINKGELAMHWLRRKNYDFVLALGAGWSDEILFQTIPPESWTIRVGVTQTSARFVMGQQQEAIDLLEKLKSGEEK